jgi:hypothetical protein
VAFVALLSYIDCHSFVGYLEEEAVKTYTHALKVLTLPTPRRVLG